jgi:trehalose-6-phosphate synthase
MPDEERRRRHEAIDAFVREHDIEAWIGSQLAEIERFDGIPTV